MWGVGCHMGGADQDIKFANSLSGEEGRRRGGGGGGCWQTSINCAEKWRQRSPLETPLWQSVFSLSICESFVKLAAKYSRWGEWASRKKTTSWSHVKERLKKVLLILRWIDHLGFLFWLHSHWWGRQRVDQEGWGQNQHDALCSALPPWAGSICIMERLGVIQFQGRPTAVRLSGPLHEGEYFTAHGPPLATLHSKRARLCWRCTADIQSPCFLCRYIVPLSISGWQKSINHSHSHKQNSRKYIRLCMPVMTS